MTRQEAFNQVWGWFVLDRHEPGGAGGFCLYYDRPTGNRCAVGCLLPLSLLQGLDARELIGPVEEFRRTHPQVREILRGCGINFLKDLQFAHDYAVSRCTWVAPIAAGPRPNFHALIEERLRDLAHRYGLTVPEPAGEEGEERLAAIEGATASAAVLSPSR